MDKTNYLNKENIDKLNINQENPTEELEDDLKFIEDGGNEEEEKFQKHKNYGKVPS